VGGDYSLLPVSSSLSSVALKDRSERLARFRARLAAALEEVCE
jgi:hypothetical protein